MAKKQRYFRFKTIDLLVGMVIGLGAHTCTKFESPTRTIRATRPLVRGKAPSKRDRRAYVMVSIGRPNFRERRFIKQCQKAGVSFPVRKVQIKMPPKRKRR